MNRSSHRQKTKPCGFEKIPPETARAQFLILADYPCHDGDHLIRTNAGFQFCLGIAHHSIAFRVHCVHPMEDNWYRNANWKKNAYI